jgi:hypothetical protein
MTGVSATEAREATKPCRVCAEPIRLAAQKCIHCDSYQDWRARINVSSTILSLLVALFSVLTVALPVIKDTLRTERPELQFFLLGASEHAVKISVINGGVRQWAIRPRGSFDVAGLFNDRLWSVVGYFTGEQNSQNLIIEPGKSAVLTFTDVGQDDLSEVDDWMYADGNLKKAYLCKVSIFATPFGGRTPIRHFCSFMCHDAVYFMDQLKARVLSEKGRK